MERLQLIPEPYENVHSQVAVARQKMFHLAASQAVQNLAIRHLDNKNYMKAGNNYIKSQVLTAHGEQSSPAKPARVPEPQITQISR